MLYLAPWRLFAASNPSQTLSLCLVSMAPGILEPRRISTDLPPRKKSKLSASADVFADDDTSDPEAVAAAVPPHPLAIKPAGNAYTATQNLKAHCGSFARLPDELLNHVFESFDAETLRRLGTTCRALYAFTRLDELWRALFVRCVTFPFSEATHEPTISKRRVKPFPVQTRTKITFCSNSTVAPPMAVRSRGKAKPWVRSSCLPP